jgi:hypothetical protein
VTSQQRSLLVVLGLANVLLLCCLAPAAFILLSSSPDQNPLQPALDALQAALPAPNPAPPPAQMPTLEAGWKLYSMPSDGFALALPSSWKQLPLDQATVSADLDAIGKKNPEFGNALGGQTSSAASLVKFIGVETALDGMAGSFSTNVNVLHRTQPVQAPLEVYIPITLKALQDLPFAGRPILHERVQTLAGEAEEFHYTNALKTVNGETITTSNRQYVLVRGKEFYVLSGSAPLNQEIKYAPIFEKIAASFRATGN